MPLASTAYTTKYSTVVEITGSNPTASSTFGAGMAVYGNHMVVGAPLDDDGGSNWGSAFIFNRDPITGVWTQALKVLPTGVSGTNKYFGLQCAAGKDRCVVSCPYDNAVDYISYPKGALYVYRLAGGLWALEAKLYVASNPGTYLGRGLYMSPDGTFIVSCTLDHTGSSGPGTVRSWYWDGATWVGPATIQRSDPSPDDYFGYSISVSADMTTMVIGSLSDDDAQDHSGAAYVFTGTPTGGYVQSQKLKASVVAQYEWFGASVGIYGDTLAVAAPKMSTEYGYIEVFRRSGGTWSFVRRIQGAAVGGAKAIGCGEFYGIASFLAAGQSYLILPDDDTIIAPSPRDTSARLSAETGSVWMFRANPDWASGYTGKVLYPDMTGAPAAYSKFGACFALSDSRMYISRPLYSLSGNNRGSVLEVSSPDGTLPWDPSVPAAIYVKRALDSAAPSPPPPIGAYVTWTTTDPAGAYGGALPYGGPLVDETILDVISE